VSAVLVLRWAWRELRGARGRLALFVLCLSVGVAAVTAVAGLASGVEGTLRGRARELLAADVVVEARRPLPAGLEAVARRFRARRTDVLETASVVAAIPADGTPGRSRLAEVKAVGPGYPWYGTVVVRPAQPLQELLDADTAVVAPELLGSLGLRVGDRLRVGGVAFRVAGTVVEEPDRRSFGLTLGPRVFLSSEGLVRASLLAQGSRVLYRALFVLPEGTDARDARRLARAMRAAAGPRFEVASYTQAQPGVREGLERAERFLGLVALLSLLVGGVGVSQTVRAWVAARLDAIAVLKCLGASGREIVALHVLEVVVLAGLGCAVGAVAGLAVQAVAPAVLGDLLPAGSVRLWQPFALLRGGLLGMGIALLFSLGPLRAARRVPPLRVLRHDAEPLPVSKLGTALLSLTLLVGLLGAAWVQGTSLRLALTFVGVVLLTSGLLAAGARGLTALLVRLPLARARVAARHGLLSLTRPGAGTLGAMVALGLGVLVVFAMAVVQDQLADGLEQDLPRRSPTAFLVDIQPDQIAPLRRTLEAGGGTDVQDLPVVMARLRAVDGRSVDDLARARGGEGRWALTREQRLSFRPDLPPSNRLVQGAWWTAPAGDEVSVEEEFAADIGARVGSVLAFDVQGVEVELRVTSLRHVEWRTFALNFFLLVEPGALERAPHVFVATARFRRGDEQRLQDRVAQAFPNVTVVRVGEILEKVSAILRRIGLGVRVVGGFTVLAGLAILAGAVGATAARRGREVALLKTIGMTRGGVVAAFAVEYLTLGVVAGLLGTAGGGVLAWAVLTQAMDLPFAVPWASAGLSVAGSAALAAAAGLAASVPALQRRPLEVLRTA
jgi:putative ABC transport system permease protein